MVTDDQWHDITMKYLKSRLASKEHFSSVLYMKFENMGGLSMWNYARENGWKKTFEILKEIFP